MTAHRSQTCADCGDPYSAPGLVTRCAGRHQTALAPLVLKHVTVALDGVAGVNITVTRGHARLSAAEAGELGRWLTKAPRKEAS
jgi:hypothetical protein